MTAPNGVPSVWEVLAEATPLFCPNCWAFADTAGACPWCGMGVRRWWHDKDYVDRLIVALGHPDPIVPARAAWLLGQLGTSRALEPLIRTCRLTGDLAVAREAIRAVAQIGGPAAEQFLSAFHAGRGALRAEATDALAALKRKEEDNGRG